MPDYRAYIVDQEGHFRAFEVISAVDDAGALEQAKKLVDGCDVELWNLGRKVALLSHKTSGG